MPAYQRIAPLYLSAVAAALLLAACGGGNGTPEGATSSPPSSTTRQASPVAVSACDLVTQADAAAILGGSAPAPDRLQTGPFESCSYYSTLRSFVQFQVCAGCLTASQFESTVKSGADTLETTLEPVSGVGDQAFWFGDGILWVRKGSVTFNVWVSTMSFYGPNGALEGEALKGVALPVARELAQKVASRLP